jgi:hypothetical protein
VQKWEYHKLEVLNGEVQSSRSSTNPVGALNQLGREGWEVVGVAATDAFSYTVLLKRPVAETDTP